MSKLTKLELLHTIIKCVPQWLEFNENNYKHELCLDKEIAFFYTKTKLTKKQNTLKNIIKTNIEEWYQHTQSLPKKLSEEYIRHQMVLNWLKIHSESILWHDLLDFLNNAADRTYENRPPIKNIIIADSSGKNGAHLNEQKIEKILDPIACSLFTYIVVDCNMNVQKYDQAYWRNINDINKYKLHPEFLHALYCEIPNNGFSAHLTTQKDIVVLHKKKYQRKIDGQWKAYDSGMILTIRKGIVHLYEPSNLKNTIYRILGDKEHNYYIAANIFEILFDLSFIKGAPSS